ncbi:HIT family protein [Adhaeribacter soli]|uniref:HIT family protein n=1 Tax=Adhaeribacter soli TaxID=2607655 RepID=A0A5N1J9W8_9BACT|nr:HIT family protein [Adhaeribacter soli]KAA9345629.1 HIT family protein [Adhaeribacter soli]
MASVFTKIIDGIIPSYKIAEDDRFYAFLDINPLTVGHTLVIPKQETDYIFDLEEDLYADLHRFSHKIAQAIKKVTNCKRVGVAVIGFEVPHAHVHLIPMNHMAEMNFANPKLKLKPEEFEAIAEKIRQAL